MMTSKILEKVIADVDTYGWHVIKVPQDADGPSFAYTIGLFKNFQHPELIVFGLQTETLHKILNNVAIKIKSGVEIPFDNLVYGILKAEVPIKFKKIRPQELSYLGKAKDYYQTDFPALQLIWPDRANILPDSNDCDVTVANLQPKLFD